MKTVDPVRLFSDYMRVVGTPRLDFDTAADPRLQGRKLGVINGSNWVSLWCDWFGHSLLPGVKIVNAGCEAVQLNFMAAHAEGRPVPPQINIDCFCRYALDLYHLYGVDAILISCSTMNRAYGEVQRTMATYGVPVVQIDEAMMELAVSVGERLLVVATHGPTVESTRSLLDETAARMGRRVSFAGATIEDAFDLLGEGRIEAHNRRIAEVIREQQRRDPVDAVVLAQLSMAVFAFSYPDPVAEFGIPVLNSAETGFRRAGEILANL